ncbi:T9SS type A sorting domain-containing protein [Kordia algicida OT-1]|uniref:CHU large protein n=1 Tax=Kordia algicida OT-1 TaxID=391587 RepID=A9DVR2_9FLAO|nr:T9SS type A sorting domain-containing protein [Kordia algicida]EDP96455.1 CHU large protein [Kordia algicida OT-1]
MMKHLRFTYLFLLVTLSFPLNTNAQNLIPNGDFELGNYNGGSDPTDYYSGVACSTGRGRFDGDLFNWYVAKPTNVWTSRCSPDWIPAGMVLGDGSCDANDSKYVRSALKNESIMTEMVGGYTLVKGRTYKFKVKVRAARGLANGTGSFQVVFSTKSEGLRVQPHKKWVALDFYVEQSCDWRNIDAYFTVPTDDNNDYEDMKYIVLQYNHEQNENGDGDSASLILHYDEVSLVEEEQCIDYKYIQDWQYFDIHKIEQANIQISAGANVSPDPSIDNLPVVVKSSAKVIYRAPTVLLEPGFFVEEPGSYFETQVGTCVEDPCPTIEAFAPSSTDVCSSATTLGENIPAQPGVFYSWSPIEYFSNPWSRITDFTPPAGSGCVNAELVIWTICGESQTFPFTMNYFDAAPSITVNSTSSGVNNLNLDLDIANANSYTVTATSVANGTVLYTDTQNSACADLNVNDVLLDLNSCLLDMCDDVEVTITASNPCFDTVEEIITWTAPTPVAPINSISNIINTDFDFQFDLTLASSYEYVVIETWNEQETSLICSQTIEACANPNISTYHFDVTNCLSGCVSQCHNYKIKVRTKNYCYPTEAVSTLSWNKSNTAFSMPSSYPNVITANGDGINDTLCFSPQGADYYHLVVVNRWGNVMFESSGCVTENPVCIWTPTNLSDGTYFYTIDFSNQCGQSGSHQDFVQIINGQNRVATDEPDKFDPVTTPEVSVYPNPSKGLFNVNLGSMSEANLAVLDITGKTIVSKNATTNVETLDLSKYAKGIYFLRIKNHETFITKKLIVE